VLCEPITCSAAGVRPLGDRPDGVCGVTNHHHGPSTPTHLDRCVMSCDVMGWDGMGWDGARAAAAVRDGGEGEGEGEGVVVVVVLVYTTTCTCTCTSSTSSIYTRIERLRGRAREQKDGAWGDGG